MDLDSAENYLRSNHIEELLEQIVTSLLQNRPSNPRKFIANLMNETTAFPSAHPQQAAQNREGEALPQRRQVAPQKQNVIGGRRFSAVSAEALLKTRDSRRQGFSSKSISNTTMEIPVYPKSPEDAATIQAAIKKISFLSFLKEEQSSALINAMFEKTYQPNDKIIIQGDKADNFYIVASGEVAVVKKDDKTGEEKQVATLKPNAYFGELALMTGGRRNATIVALTPVKCWAIDQTTYLYLLRDLHYQRRQKCKEIISKVPLLAGLPDYEALLVAESLVIEEFKEGTEVIKQGDKGDKFYLLLNGEADVIINGKVVNHLADGSYFGELALIYDTPRAATIKSTKPIKVASISGEMFRKVLEKCSSTFKANEQSYHKN